MRKRLRLRDFDYSSNNAYFVTIATYDRRPLLTNDSLQIATEEFDALPARFAGLTIDCCELMVDHLHAILLLIQCASTLSAIVQAYKSISARRIKQVISVDRVWQRSFYDHIVRNDVELEALREYVRLNRFIHAERSGEYE